MSIISEIQRSVQEESNISEIQRIVEEEEKLLVKLLNLTQIGKGVTDESTLPTLQALSFQGLSGLQDQQKNQDCNNDKLKIDFVNLPVIDSIQSDNKNESVNPYQKQLQQIDGVSEKDGSSHLTLQEDDLSFQKQSGLDEHQDQQKNQQSNNDKLNTISQTLPIDNIQSDNKNESVYPHQQQLQQIDEVSEKDGSSHLTLQSGLDEHQDQQKNQECNNYNLKTENLNLLSIDSIQNNQNESINPHQEEEKQIDKLVIKNSSPLPTFLEVALSNQEQSGLYENPDQQKNQESNNDYPENTTYIKTVSQIPAIDSIQNDDNYQTQNYDINEKQSNDADIQSKDEENECLFSCNQEEKQAIQMKSLKYTQTDQIDNQEQERNYGKSKNRDDQNKENSGNPKQFDQNKNMSFCNEEEKSNKYLNMGQTRIPEEIQIGQDENESQEDNESQDDYYDYLYDCDEVEIQNNSNHIIQINNITKKNECLVSNDQEQKFIFKGDYKIIIEKPQNDQKYNQNQENYDKEQKNGQEQSTKDNESLDEQDQIIYFNSCSKKVKLDNETNNSQNGSTIATIQETQIYFLQSSVINDQEQQFINGNQENDVNESKNDEEQSTKENESLDQYDQFIDFNTCSKKQKSDNETNNSQNDSTIETIQETQYQSQQSSVLNDGEQQFINSNQENDAKESKNDEDQSTKENESLDWCGQVADFSPCGEKQKSENENNYSQNDSTIETIQETQYQLQQISVLNDEEQQFINGEVHTIYESQSEFSLNYQQNYQHFYQLQESFSQDEQFQDIFTQIKILSDQLNEQKVLNEDTYSQENAFQQLMFQNVLSSSQIEQNDLSISIEEPYNQLINYQLIDIQQQTGPNFDQLQEIREYIEHHDHNFNSQAEFDINIQNIYNEHNLENYSRENAYQQQSLFKLSTSSQIEQQNVAVQILNIIQEEPQNYLNDNQQQNDQNFYQPSIIYGQNEQLLVDLSLQEEQHFLDFQNEHQEFNDIIYSQENAYQRQTNSNEDPISSQLAILVSVQDID